MSRDVIWSDIGESDGRKETKDKENDDESARSVSVVVVEAAAAKAEFIKRAKVVY